MNAEIFVYVAKMMIIVSMVMTPLAEAKIVVAAFEAIGRNPQLEESLFSKTIIALALVESTAIYALVAFFTL